MSWRIIISGIGKMPDIATEADTVVVPPPPPPPPPLPPPADISPFIWPPQPPTRYDPSERYAALGSGFYASQPEYENPLPASNAYAGRIVMGTAGGWNLAGYALWAPRDADPAAIRRALASGRP